MCLSASVSFFKRNEMGSKRKKKVKKEYNIWEKLETGCWGHNLYLKIVFKPSKNIRPTQKCREIPFTKIVSSPSHPLDFQIHAYTLAEEQQRPNSGRHIGVRCNWVCWYLFFRKILFLSIPTVIRQITIYNKQY